MANPPHLSGTKRSLEELNSTQSAEEILQENNRLVEEANIAIKEGWGKEGVCTFSKGYKSQNIYSCATCQANTEMKDRFGFCFGCSMQCHVNHDVYELFNKRNFRCDCGLSHCGSCELDPKENEAENSENKYSHNFEGLYCFCSKPYNPDTDEMLQCYACQDWFHVECIEDAPCNQPQKAEIPVAPTAQEHEKIEGAIEKEVVEEENERLLVYVPVERDDCQMICYRCMEKVPFLYSYIYNQTLPLALEYIARDVVIEEQKEPSTSNCSKPAINTQGWPSFTTFWNPGWRLELCNCNTCINLYKEANAEFITEEEEEEDEEEHTTGEIESLEEMGAKQISSVMPDITVQQNMSYAFSDLSAELKKFLAPFAQNNIEVTKEDITRFYEEQLQKKRKLN